MLDCDRTWSRLFSLKVAEVSSWLRQTFGFSHCKEGVRIDSRINVGSIDSSFGIIGHVLLAIGQINVWDSIEVGWIAN